MPTLNLLDIRKGFTAGDLDTDGYVAMQAAYQTMFFADGRTASNNGYHKMDFVNTRINGVANGLLFIGEVVTQVTSGAVGIYIEGPDLRVTVGAIASGPFQKGELLTQAGSLARGYAVKTVANGTTLLYIYETFGTFNNSGVITGGTSGATATASAVVARGLGNVHLIYRTSTTEFDATNNITGADSASVITMDTVVAEIQTLTPDITATSGTFTLTFLGETTASIAYDATTTAIKTAFELLTTVGTVTVGGTIFSAGTGGLTITFATTYGDAPIISIAESMGGTTAVTVTQTTEGHLSVVAPPHWLPWMLWTATAGTGAYTQKGTFPDGGSNIMALAFGRIFMNNLTSPHQWFATRAGDPQDIQVSQSDVGSAASSQTSEAGLVGDEITAMAPYKDYYLVFGCVNEVWVLRSDPVAGGILTRVSKTTGIFSNTSFCWDDKENFYFMGSDGIYSISAEALVNAQAPVNITKQHAPRLVRDMALNRRTDRVAMAYDKDRYGILISVTQMDGGWSTIFWIDLRTGGIFPEDYNADHLPASLHYFNARRKDERLLLAGGQDGYIRKFDDDTYSDDGSNAIDSWAFIGPITDPETARGKVKLSSLSVTTGTDTTELKVSLFSAETAEELVDNIIAGAAPSIARTFSGDNLFPTIRQKIENGAIAVRLGNDTAAKGWSIEKIIANIKPSGRIN